MPRPKSYIMMGVDPGFRNTGFAIAKVQARSSVIKHVIAVGLINTEGRTDVRISSDKYRRACELSHRLQYVADHYKVDVIACEFSSRSATKYARFDFGVMCGVIAGLGMPLFEVSPQQVKQAATGSRTASKKEVIEWALEATRQCRGSWPTTHVPNKMGLMFKGRMVASYAEHLADALAAIQACIQTPEWLKADKLPPWAALLDEVA